MPYGKSFSGGISILHQGTIPIPNQCLGCLCAGGSHGKSDYDFSFVFNLTVGGIIHLKTRGSEAKLATSQEIDQEELEIQEGENEIIEENELDTEKVEKETGEGGIGEKVSHEKDLNDAGIALLEKLKEKYPELYRELLEKREQENENEGEGEDETEQ
ncbi:6967_t:CDS:2 [Ambispora leptoticha]|uniref:6967_t:CDS:1 n=1 Tax=Ambispora leptoticha TaxID=144679 RepID=A0A9N8YPA4_9GLOM|nr:6967_t:CDS:2 [Ambispora leptoticha]